MPNTKVKKIVYGVFTGLAFLSIFLPYMLNTIAILDIPIMIIKITAVLIVGLLMLHTCFSQRKIPAFFVLVNFICIINIIITYINKGYLTYAIWGNFILLNTIIAIIYLGIKSDLKWFLQLIIISLITVLLFNTMTIIHTYIQYGTLKPDIEYDYLFLCGNYNGFIQWYYLLQLVLYIYACIYSGNGKILLLFIGFAILITMIIMRSVTSSVIFLILDILLLFLNKKPLEKLFNIFTYMTFNFLLFISVIIFRVQNSAFFAEILKIVGKNTTFTGRTQIWDSAISAIMQRPVLGYGYEFTEQVEERLTDINAHNMYLQLLYEGGFIECAIYFVIIGFTVKEILNIENKNLKLALEAFLGVFFLCFMTQVHTIYFRYTVPAIMYFVARKLRESNERKEVAE